MQAAIMLRDAKPSFHTMLNVSALI